MREAMKKSVMGFNFTAIFCILTGLWLVSPVHPEADEAEIQTLTAARRTAFLAALEGPWSGQASVTPVGPRPYDMTFVRTAPHRVEGEAHPGASTHYWSFYEEEATLRLRFLSTFAGNQTPLWLVAMAEQEEALVFRAVQPHFLAVHVRPQAHTLTMRIFLRGKPHVEIHLARRPASDRERRFPGARE
jgi:hypothetical protein